MGNEKNKASEILNFNFSVTVLKERAEFFAERVIKKELKQKSKELNKITEDIIEKYIFGEETNKTKDVLKIFLDNAKNDNYLLNNFTLRDIDFLINYISEKRDEEISIYESSFLLSKLLFLIQEKWKDRLIIKLFRLILKKWRDPNNEENFNYLFQYFITKLQRIDYISRNIEKIFKGNNFFDNLNGDLILGKTIALLNEDLSYIKRRFNFPDHFLAFPYFSRVLLSYIENKKGDIEQLITEIKESFDKFNPKGKFKILIISYLIKKTNGNFNQEIQDFAFKKIGDPEKKILWELSGLNSEELNIINDARDILNEWIKQNYISAFFEKVIEDDRRKKFWLKYKNYISKFRIIGNNYTKIKLLQDSRIRNVLSERFIEVIKNNEDNAIMMKIKNKIIIEFSKIGSCYVYNENNPHVPNFNAKTISSIKELKDTSINRLLYRNRKYIYDMKEEGALHHMDGVLHWDKALSEWIENKLGIYV